VGGLNKAMALEGVSILCAASGAVVRGVPVPYASAGDAAVDARTHRRFVARDTGVVMVIETR
jgi:hypothetical protein